MNLIIYCKMGYKLACAFFRNQFNGRFCIKTSCSMFLISKIGVLSVFFRKVKTTLVSILKGIYFPISCVLEVSNSSITTTVCSVKKYINHPIKESNYSSDYFM